MCYNEKCDDEKRCNEKYIDEKYSSNEKYCNEKCYDEKYSSNENMLMRNIVMESVVMKIENNTSINTSINTKLTKKHYYNPSFLHYNQTQYMNYYTTNKIV